MTEPHKTSHCNALQFSKIFLTWQILTIICYVFRTSRQWDSELELGSRRCDLSFEKSWYLHSCYELPSSLLWQEAGLFFKWKNCFYSDIEDKMTALFTKACDDSFVLHIAVKTNASEGFVFTAIWSTNQITGIGMLSFCSLYRCKHKCLLRHLFLQQYGEQIKQHNEEW